MRLRWRRHKCPADVELAVVINGETVIGPINGESLAYIAKYSGGVDYAVNLMENVIPGGRIDTLEVQVRYLPR